jgi:NADPH-dependent ferric siderophore reductase
MVNKKTQKATKSSRRTKVTAKATKEMKAATQSAPSVKSSPTRSKAARAHIAEGTRLFALAGRRAKVQFVKVHGPKGPTMTWAERAKAGVDAKHFQETLKVKS